MNPRLLAAGERWARGYRRRHQPARTDQDRLDDFAIAEHADENERWRGR